MLTNCYEFIFLIIFLLVVMFVPLAIYSHKYSCACKNAKVEPFLSGGNYPKSVEQPILNSYPSTDHKIIDKDDYSNNWIHYPVFSLGSYEQITNNLRYYKNPDNGL